MPTITAIQQQAIEADEVSVSTPYSHVTVTCDDETGEITVQFHSDLHLQLYITMGVKEAKVWKSDGYEVSENDDVAPF